MQEDPLMVMMVKLPGAAESQCPPHRCTTVPTLTGVRYGHATADRMAAGVISPHRRWTGKGGRLTPSALRPRGQKIKESGAIKTDQEKN